MVFSVILYYYSSPNKSPIEHPKIHFISTWFFLFSSPDFRWSKTWSSSTCMSTWVRVTIQTVLGWLEREEESGLKCQQRKKIDKLCEWKSSELLFLLLSLPKIFPEWLSSWQKVSLVVVPKRQRLGNIYYSHTHTYKLYHKQPTLPPPYHHNQTL